jgi:putative transposase
VAQEGLLLYRWGDQTDPTKEQQKPMADHSTLLACLVPLLTLTTIRPWSQIVVALLAMTGRVTMQGMARWTGKGGSYRTIQRFFATAIPWEVVFWVFFRTHLFDPDDVYLMGGDETVTTKAGKHPHGLNRFFSSLAGQAVPGLAFFTLSLISSKQRRSFPIPVAQRLRADEAATTSAKKPQPKRSRRTKASSSNTPAPKRKPGRPKGSKNKLSASQPLSEELQQIGAMVGSLLARIGGIVPVTYLVLDGHFGNAPALQMTRQHKLHLISKLRADSALYLPYTGAYAGRGPRRKYGEKLDYDALPEQFLGHTTLEDKLETRVYQLEVWSKAFPQRLNVVILVKTRLDSDKQAHIILFRSDLALPAAQLVEYYALRFQLEFNFRDAKQFWGLEDFMNTQPTPVTNAANLSLFMVNLSHCLLQPFRQHDPAFSLLDLKAHYRGLKYVEETIKMLPETPEPLLLERIITRVVSLGRIHAAVAEPIPA